MWKKFKSKLKKVEPERFELSTPALQGQCSSQLSYDPKHGSIENSRAINVRKYT